MLMTPGSRFLHRLAADRSGIAMVEYAIVLPVLLTLGLGGIELANIAIANLRISQIAMTTADNAGRVRDSIDEADILELLEGAEFVGRGINFAENGRIILSDLEYNSATKQWMRWQRCTGKLQVSSSYGKPLKADGTEVTDFSDSTKAATDYGAVPDRSTITEVGPTGNKIAATTGNPIMFVEIFYNYQPIVRVRFLGTPQQMRYSGAFNVRQRTDQNLKRGGVETAKMATCRKYERLSPAT